MRSDFILDRVRLLFSGLKLWEEINVSCVEGIESEDGIRFELICIYESKKIIIIHIIRKIKSDSILVLK